jgi:hypothetical protein
LRRVRVERRIKGMRILDTKIEFERMHSGVPQHIMMTVVHKICYIFYEDHEEGVFRLQT